jgi:hypothetical protein
MNDMKKQALDKLMMVLDDILGGDVKSRMSKGEEKPKMEMEDEEEGEDMKEGKEVASGGSSILGLPEVGEEDEGAVKKDKMPSGIGLEVEKVEVSGMPKSNLMKKLRGMKA